VVLNESILRRPVGGREVIAAQLYALAETGELPNVQLRVVPFGQLGTVAVRDSKDPSGPALTFTPVGWQAFTRGVKNGAADPA
jgi:hypothetical protein